MRGLRGLLGLGVAALVIGTIAEGAGPAPVPRERELPDRRPLPDDNLTFRPTVVVRKGKAQGSGTVIASVEGESLVLTAAHVVKEPGELVVELHRYNLGLERAGARGRWPKVVAGEIAASDRAADVAIVRVRKLPSLPFVARLAPGDQEPARGAVVVSVGIDRGTHLSSWRSRVREVAWLALEDGRGERSFVITVQPPERGRSGGGLFLEGGALTGVCIGRAEMVRGRISGVFASGASIRRLLRDYDLDAAVGRSEARRAALTRRSQRTPVTPTQARPGVGSPGSTP
jgi:S1-C subfamily serine protease